VDTPTLIVLVIAVILAVSYFAGGILNRRRAARWVRALRAAFPDAAEAHLTWPARNAFHIEFQEPLTGVRQMAIQGLLLPREALPVWALWASQGRGDLLSIRADLIDAPLAVGLAFDPGQRLGRAVGKAAAAEGSQVTPVGRGRMQIAWHEAAARPLLERLAEAGTDAGSPVFIEVRAAQPRLTVVVSSREPPETTAGNLETAAQRLVKIATRRSD
jgi:hypothetical protein